MPLVVFLVEAIVDLKKWNQLKSLDTFQIFLPFILHEGHRYSPGSSLADLLGLPVPVSTLPQNLAVFLFASELSFDPDRPRLEVASGHLSEFGQEAAGAQPVSALGPQVLSQQVGPVTGLQASPCFVQPMCHIRGYDRECFTIRCIKP